MKLPRNYLDNFQNFLWYITWQLYFQSRQWCEVWNTSLLIYSYWIMNIWWCQIFLKTTNFFQNIASVVYGMIILGILNILKMNMNVTRCKVGQNELEEKSGGSKILPSALRKSHLKMEWNTGIALQCQRPCTCL